MLEATQGLGYFRLILLICGLGKVFLYSVPQKYHEDFLPRKYTQRGKNTLYLGQQNIRIKTGYVKSQKAQIIT